MVCKKKVRIRFSKGGNLRLISHHDLMRCWERMLRRAELPYHSTQGFNPKPRLVFALSLGLGIVGREEVAELELDADIADAEVRDRLAQQAPEGLTIFSVRDVDVRASAQVRRVVYRAPISTGEWEKARSAVEMFLASPEWFVEREKPRPRKADIRPFVHAIEYRAGHLELDVWVTPNGSARPDELLVQIGLSEFHAAGGVIERSIVEIRDECADFGGVLNSRPIGSTASHRGSASQNIHPSTPAAEIDPRAWASALGTLD